MKLLQIKNTKEPRILKAGVHFDIITSTGKLLKITNSNPLECDTICSLDDCYQSRPLIEIDGFCEFDVIEVTYLDKRPQKQIHAEWEQVNYNHPTYGEKKHFLFFENIIVNNNKNSSAIVEKKISESIDSIFTKENKLKYPELYTEALKLINQSTI